MRNLRTGETPRLKNSKKMPINYSLIKLKRFKNDKEGKQLKRLANKINEATEDLIKTYFSK